MVEAHKEDSGSQEVFKDEVIALLFTLPTLLATFTDLEAGGLLDKNELDRLEKVKKLYVRLHRNQNGENISLINPGLLLRIGLVEILKERGIKLEEAEKQVPLNVQNTPQEKSFRESLGRIAEYFRGKETEQALVILHKSFRYDPEEKFDPKIPQDPGR